MKFNFISLLFLASSWFLVAKAISKLDNSYTFSGGNLTKIVKHFSRLKNGRTSYGFHYPFFFKISLFCLPSGIFHIYYA